MEEEIIFSASPEETGILASTLLKGNHHVITFKGELGAGKTTLIQSLGKFLKVDRLTSPTFTLVKEYPLEHPDFKTLYHIDLYRLTSKEEALELGINEILSDSKNLVLIEWPQIIETLLPPHLEVNLEITGQNQRRITLKYPKDS